MYREGITSAYTRCKRTPCCIAPHQNIASGRRCVRTYVRVRTYIHTGTAELSLHTQTPKRNLETNPPDSILYTCSTPNERAIERHAERAIESFVHRRQCVRDRICMKETGQKSLKKHDQETKFPPSICMGCIRFIPPLPPAPPSPPGSLSSCVFLWSNTHLSSAKP